MAPDIPIPAPANWPFQARPQFTDQPVLPGPQYHAVRHINRGCWHVGLFGGADNCTVLSHGTYVVDDYGSLQAIDHTALNGNDLYWCSQGGTDVAADEWLLAQIAEADGFIKQRQQADVTRALLRPAPVTVEIVTAPPHALCAASIVVGPDPRIDSPTYSIHVDGEAPLLLTHAQLCALMLGAGQLVRATTGRKGRLQ